jgi:hypothetical protein
VDPGLAALLVGALFGVGGLGGLAGYLLKGRLDQEAAAIARSEERAAAAKEMAAAVAAAKLEREWSNAHKAAEWLMSEDPATRRLGADHLIALRDTWTVDATVRSFVAITIGSALTPTIQAVNAAAGERHSLPSIVRTSSSAAPKVPAPDLSGGQAVD